MAFSKGHNKGFRYFYDKIIPFVLFLLFFIIYFNSIDIYARNFHHWNFIFDADSSRVIRAFTDKSWPNLADLHKHPLYLIFFRPITSFIRNIIHNPDKSTLLVTSFLGALAIPVVYLIFFQFLKKRIDSLLFTIIFACSSSVWLLCSIPETFSLNSLMIVLAFYLQSIKTSLGQYKRAIKVSIIYIFYSFIAAGITLSNIVYSFLSYINFQRKYKNKVWQKIIYLFCYILMVTFLLVAFSNFQNKIYPGTHIFSKPESFMSAISQEKEYFILDTKALASPSRAADLIKTFFIDNIIAAKANLKYVYDFGMGWNILGFENRKEHISNLTLLFYITFFILTAISLIIKKSFKNKDIQLVSAFIGFNLIFHFFYHGVGIPFIFSIHLVFSIIFLMMYSYRGVNFRFKSILLTIFTALVVINNSIFIARVNSLLRNAKPEKEKILSASKD